MLRKILILIPAIFLAACGTITAQDYTDAKMEAAIANARIEAAQAAAMADAQRLEWTREAIRLLLEEWASQEGRRPHRPGVAQ